ncbi:MAG TPA: 2-isopropylmalate synthase [Polyangia bacterium]
MTFDARKYPAAPTVHLPDRTWPDRTLDHAPIWCSVDLRDGNQALAEPMGRERKQRFFDALVHVGFKEIEVGFPAASQTEFDFVRALIDEGRIPDDVTIQVLTQARDHLIKRTFQALQGARRAIVHVYNSVSTLQRRVVFGMEQAGVKDIAVQGVRLARDEASKLTGTEIVLEYSPESFTGTELPFAVEVCNAVTEEWQPTRDRKLIFNLPATVEMSSPNVYADQIEWMHRHLNRREALIISVHTHNDRGCAIAAAELAMLAGAERVEGTLFGNGERTGNADVVALAMNLYAQGIQPGLDLSDLPALVEVFQTCNQLPVPPRHPYAGELVFTAFSGSHQDAIRKGLTALEKTGTTTWEVPYLPINPADVGRQYEPLIRINSQSGKGGVAYVLEHSCGFRVPKALAIEFSQVIQGIAETTGKELTAQAIIEAFEGEYLGRGRFSLIDFAVSHPRQGACEVHASLSDGDRALQVQGHGTGPIDGFVHGLASALGVDLHLVDYSEHALGDGADAEAVAYVGLRAPDGRVRFGVGRDRDIVRASLTAACKALERERRDLSSRTQ